MKIWNMKTSKNSNDSQTQKKGKKWKLLHVQCLLHIFKKTPSVIIVSQRNRKVGWTSRPPATFPLHFLALLSQDAIKKIYAFFAWKIFVAKILLPGKFLSFCPWSKKQLGILGMSFLSCSLFRGLNCKSCFADSSSIFTFPSVVRPQTWHPSISEVSE